MDIQDVRLDDDAVEDKAAKTRRPGMRALSPLLAFSLGALLATHMQAQQTGGDSESQPASASSQTSPQPAKSAKAPQSRPKSASQENPFPSDVSQKAAQPQDQQSDAPAAPDTQTTPKPSDAARDNPFPEDVSKGAAAAAKGSGNSSSSSSSNNDWSSSNPGGDADPNADLPRDSGRRKLKKPSDDDIQSGSLAGQGRAQDDVKVGRYYLQTEDYRGAYGRFSEAARLDPTSLDAIYGLAAAAAGLHRTDEALSNYKLYLEIAPDGSDAKSARKAIRELSK